MSQSDDDDRYEYVKAIVEDGGQLRWQHKVFGSEAVGRMRHDESVEGWSDEAIIELTCSMLCVEDDNRDVITVEHW